MKSLHKIGNKLALIMISLAVVVAAFLATLFYYQFDQALRERVLLQLSSVKQLKLVKIEAEITDRVALFELQKSELSTQDSLAGFFNYIKSPTKPDKIGIYQLSNDINWSNNIQLIDVTDQHPTREITIGFYRRIEETYYLAVAQVSEIQQILLERTGLGESGESYLVGKDFHLKSKSRFAIPSGENPVVMTDGVIRALAGNPGEDSFFDYRGIHVFGSYAKIDINGLIWVMLSEINSEEALKPILGLRRSMMSIVAVIIAFILIVSYYLSNMIVSPLVAMEKKLIQLSQGNQERDDDFTISDREDEIGHMFLALNKLLDALGNTVCFADEIGSGNFEAEFKQLGPHDTLGAALIQMKQKLQQYKENERMHQRENQRSMLSGEEKERSRLSKDLHDGLGPLLTTLRLDIQSTKINQKLKTQLLKKLDYTIQEVRHMSNNLMPSVLKDFGVGEAVANMVEDIRESSEISVRYKHDIPETVDIDGHIQISVYRIVQEAINNTLKHANATEIKLSLTFFGDHLSLFVSDNGCGFNVQEIKAGNGVRNMKERVNLSSGNMNIFSDQNGTTIEIEIPIL